MKQSIIVSSLAVVQLLLLFISIGEAATHVAAQQAASGGVCSPACQHQGYCNGNNTCQCREGFAGLDCRTFQCQHQPGTAENGPLNASGMCTACDPNHEGMYCQMNKTCGWDGDSSLEMYRGVIPLGKRHKMECAIADATFTQILNGKGDLLIDCDRDDNASWSRPGGSNNNSRCMMSFLRVGAISKRREEFFSCYSSNCTIKHVLTNVNRNPVFFSKISYEEPVGAKVLRALLSACGISVGLLFLVPVTNNMRAIYLPVVLGLTVFFLVLTASLGAHINEQHNNRTIQTVNVESAEPQMHGMMSCSFSQCKCNMEALDQPNCRIQAVQDFIEKGLSGGSEMDCNNDTGICVFVPRGVGALSSTGFNVALKCHANTCIERDLDRNVSASLNIFVPTEVSPVGTVVGIAIGGFLVMCIILVIIAHYCLRRSTQKRWDETYKHLKPLENSSKVPLGPRHTFVDTDDLADNGNTMQIVSPASGEAEMLTLLQQQDIERIQVASAISGGNTPSSGAARQLQHYQHQTPSAVARGGSQEELMAMNSGPGRASSLDLNEVQQHQQQAPKPVSPRAGCVSSTTPETSGSGAHTAVPVAAPGQNVAHGSAQQQQQQQQQGARRRSFAFVADDHEDSDEIRFSLEVRCVSYIVHGVPKMNNAAVTPKSGGGNLSHKNSNDSKYNSNSNSNNNLIAGGNDNHHSTPGGCGGGEGERIVVTPAIEINIPKKSAIEPPKMSFVRHQMEKERVRNAVPTTSVNSCGGNINNNAGETGVGATSVGSDSDGDYRIPNLSGGGGGGQDGGAGGGGNGAADFTHVYRSNDDKQVHVPESDSRLVLDRVSFQLNSGKVTALLGGSGAGKSTVLDILCNRPKKFEQFGQVLLDGVPLDQAPATYSRLLSYVSDEDALLPTQTVTESLHFSADLRLPVHVPQHQKDQLVEHAIELFGLQRVAHNVIGSQMTSEQGGLSHGERRRLAIAVMVISFPRVLVLDEPTSGLDSFNARIVVNVLRHISRGTLCKNLPYFAAAFPYKPIVLLSIHQPSPDMFNIFDDVLLLAHGHCIFSGPTHRLEMALDQVGLYDRLSQVSVPDQALQVSCTLPEDKLRELAALNRYIVRKVIAKSRLRPPASSSSSSASPGKKPRMPVAVADRASPTASPLFSAVDNTLDYFPDFVEQLALLLRRGWNHLLRKPAIFSIHFLVYTVMALIVSGMYSNPGKDIGQLMGKAGMIAFFSLFTSLTSMSALDLILSERSTYIFEKSAEAYSTAAYFASKCVLDFCLLRVLPTAIACCIFYFNTGFRPQTEPFGLFMGACILFSVAMAGLSICIASVTNGFSSAILLNGLIVMLFFAFGGLISQDETLPPAAAWVKWVSPFAFVLEAIVGNDLKGQLCFFDIRGPTGLPLTATPLPMPCETFLTQLGVSVELITVDLAMLGVWSAVYVILTFLTLHYVAKGAR